MVPVHGGHLHVASTLDLLRCLTACLLTRGMLWADSCTLHCSTAARTALSYCLPATCRWLKQTAAIYWLRSSPVPATD